MALRFDHIVIKVQDLSEARKSYESAGFTVTPGGVHKGGISENELIFFKDGTFLELLKIRTTPAAKILQGLFRLTRSTHWVSSKKLAMLYRFYSRAFQVPAGITDYCLLAENYEQEMKAMESRGIWLSAPLRASRKKPDKSVTHWEMLVPENDLFPFLRSDYSPKGNLPAASVQHANGIEGIGTFSVIVNDLDAATNLYETFLGLHPTKTDEYVAFHLQTTVVRLTAAHDTNPARSSAPQKNYGIQFINGQPTHDLPELMLLL